MSNSKDVGSLSRIWQPLFVLGCLLAVTIVVVACSSGNSVSTSGMASVKVTLSDPATCQTPSGPYSNVYVTVSDVEANVSSTASATDGSWVDLTPNLKSAPIQVDLLSLSGNSCLLKTLGDNLELQAGSYQQIRLILATTSTGVSSDMCSGAGNCVVVSGTTYPLLLSSEAQTGIKIPSGQISGGAFNISAGQTKDLNIDFNTCESIVVEGNHQYRLKPVLHAGEVSTTSVSMNGTVKDAAMNPVQGAMVSLEQKDSAGIDRVLVSTSTAADGTWVFCPLTAGDTSKPYDVVITGSDSAGVLYAPTIVTGVSIGDTVGTMTLYAPPTALATAALSAATLSGQVDSNSPVEIDVAASALESVSGTDYTIPLPILSGQSTAWLSLVTAAQTTQNPACASGTYCADYQMILPSTGAYIAAWSATPATPTQPAPLATYLVDGMATSTSTGAVDCTTSDLQSTAIALSGAGPFTASASTLAFAGCN